MEINRRLLSDDNPDTATCYNSLAQNLNAQGKYAEADQWLRAVKSLDAAGSGSPSPVWNAPAGPRSQCAPPWPLC